jgi:peroxiredoxin
MTKANSTFIDIGDSFPNVELQLLSGEKMVLPGDLADGYAVMLFYRGYCWPYCRQQLADFQAAIQAYNAEQIKVIAGSVDPVDKTKELSDKLGIIYPIAYGLDDEKISRLTGGFYERRRNICN